MTVILNLVSLSSGFATRLEKSQSCGWFVTISFRHKILMQRNSMLFDLLMSMSIPVCSLCISLYSLKGPGFRITHPVCKSGFRTPRESGKSCFLSCSAAPHSPASAQMLRLHGHQPDSAAPECTPSSAL